METDDLQENRGEKQTIFVSSYQFQSPTNIGRNQVNLLVYAKRPTLLFLAATLLLDQKINLVSPCTIYFNCSKINRKLLNKIYPPLRITMWLNFTCILLNILYWIFLLDLIMVSSG